jgi:hypothetical protein
MSERNETIEFSNSNAYGNKYTIEPTNGLTKVSVSFWMKSGNRFTFEASAVSVSTDGNGVVDRVSAQNADTDLEWLKLSEIEAVTKDV